MDGIWGDHFTMVLAGAMIALTGGLMIEYEVVGKLMDWFKKFFKVGGQND